MAITQVIPGILSGADLFQRINVQPCAITSESVNTTGLQISRIWRRRESVEEPGPFICIHAPLLQLEPKLDYDREGNIIHEPGWLFASKCPLSGDVQESAKQGGRTA